MYPTDLILDWRRAKLEQQWREFTIACLILAAEVAILAALVASQAYPAHS